MAQEDVLGGGGSVISPAAVLFTPPNGLEQILATFGDIYEYVRKDGSLDPRWQADFLARATLPFALKLSWDLETSVTQMTCHKKLIDVFADVFERILSAGLQAKVQTLGGCFSFRAQRTGSKLSTHAWGIAVDLNPTTNAQGSAGDMDAGIVEIFRAAGFTWGGDWQGKRRDAMHFQFCSRY
ncbi:MAG TPA: M15 family metallopeptidase [Candidatus Limnocylindrales bacterium]|nr:M15 family metallopeptidase [Candidatus Limnocylindrales bacterium]